MAVLSWWSDLSGKKEFARDRCTVIVIEYNIIRLWHLVQTLY